MTFDKVCTIRSEAHDGEFSTRACKCLPSNHACSHLIMAQRSSGRNQTHDRGRYRDFRLAHKCQAIASPQCSIWPCSHPLSSSRGRRASAAWPQHPWTSRPSPRLPQDSCENSKMRVKRRMKGVSDVEMNLKKELSREGSGKGEWKVSCESRRRRKLSTTEKKT